MRKSALLASVVTVTPVAFVNTNAGGKLFIATMPVPADLDQAGFAALTWVQVKGVGNHGETGTTTNILTYDTWDTDVVQKGKGMSNAGDPEIELARIPTDPGQILLAAAALTNLNYAFMVQRNDQASAAPGATPTIRYNRGLVVGPRHPNGRNEDFDLEVYTLGLQQREVQVNPSAGGNPPVETVAPAITGTAQVGQVLTTSTGTFTGDATITYAYQWFVGGVAKAGANASTYTPVAGDVGKIVNSRVTATNLSGNATGVSAPTAAVIA